jgi:hypothetical protein
MATVRAKEVVNELEEMGYDDCRGGGDDSGRRDGTDRRRYLGFCGHRVDRLGDGGHWHRDRNGDGHRRHHRHRYVRHDGYRRLRYGERIDERDAGHVHGQLRDDRIIDGQLRDDGVAVQYLADDGIVDRQLGDDGVVVQHLADDGVALQHFADDGFFVDQLAHDRQQRHRGRRQFVLGLHRIELVDRLDGNERNEQLRQRERQQRHLVRRRNVDERFQQQSEITRCEKSVRARASARARADLSRNCGAAPRSPGTSNPEPHRGRSAGRRFSCSRSSPRSSPPIPSRSRPRACSTRRRERWCNQGSSWRMETASRRSAERCRPERR